jgi:hypothetical protein
MKRENVAVIIALAVGMFLGGAVVRIWNTEKQSNPVEIRQEIDHFACAKYFYIKPLQKYYCECCDVTFDGRNK